MRVDEQVLSVTIKMAAISVVLKAVWAGTGQDIGGLNTRSVEIH